MKNVVCRYLLVVGMTLFSFVGTANAVIDYSGPIVNLGQLEIGQHDTIFGKSNGRSVISKINASLPSQSAVTFSYNFKGGLRGGALAIGGKYSYPLGGDQHEGYAVAITTKPLSISGSTVNGVPVENALAYASADLDVSNNMASATIRNSSYGVLDIRSVIIAFLGKRSAYSVSYEVTETPVPAALPMFAMGLCAVAGIRKRKNRKDEIAA